MILSNVTFPPVVHPFLRHFLKAVGAIHQFVDLRDRTLLVGLRLRAGKSDDQVASYVIIGEFNATH